MSADNGIYIGRFLAPCNDDFEPSESGKPIYDYRVVHASAIENCDYVSSWVDELSVPNEVIDAWRVLYYGHVNVFTDRSEAQKEAVRLQDEVVSSEFPVLEYGISEICYDVSFPTMTMDEANKLINDNDTERQEAIQKERDKQVAVKCLVTKGMFSHEYFVMVQDYPSITPVIWRGWVSKNWVRVDREKGTTDEGYMFGSLNAYKIKEEVKTEKTSYSETSQLMYLIEFPMDGFEGKRIWVEPRMIEGTW